MNPSPLSSVLAADDKNPTRADAESGKEDVTKNLFFLYRKDKSSKVKSVHGTRADRGSGSSGAGGSGSDAVSRFGPNDKVHVVKAEDTLDKIAEEAKVPMWKVMMWNDDVLKSKDNIKVGQELVVFRDDEVDERAKDFEWIEELKKRLAKRILAVPHHPTALWK